MVEKITYVGRDLEAMSFAINYHRWILQIFKPYLGTRLVEVGAGTGSFTELLSKHTAESLSLIEPSEAMYEMLEERVEKLNYQTPVQTYNTTFRGVADQLKVAQQPDSIIYVNVLEHISDDEDELAAVYCTLGNGGRIFIFVPALHWLFGSFDEQIGHHRRYAKTELESKCRGAGFKIIECKYFDTVGIVPWYIKYCLLRSNTMESQAVKLYDRYVVPALRVVESHVSPPIGKNVVLIAEKP